MPTDVLAFADMAPLLCLTTLAVLFALDGNTDRIVRCVGLVRAPAPQSHEAT